MHPRSTQLVVLLLLTVPSPAVAGITVQSYHTLASVNAFAPLSLDEYFAEQRLVNVAPAIADAFGDWTGPNAGGSTPTWHFIGSAHATSMTSFDHSMLVVTAEASFTYDITTTADFRDPRSADVYTPGAAANYRGFFYTDVPAAYTVVALLNPRGRVRLSSFEGIEVFDRSNHGAMPEVVELTGTMPAGNYDFLATTSLGAPLLPDGINHFTASGSFEDLTFTVQVPEPSAFGLVTAMILIHRRKRCACDDTTGQSAYSGLANQ